MNKFPNLLVHVTHDLIADSVQQDSRHCMIAEAVRNRGFKGVVVTAETISFNDGQTRYMYPMPARIATKLLAFDAGKPVKPFDITLNGNTALARPIYKRKPVGPATQKRAKRGKRTVVKSTQRRNGIATIIVKD